MTNAQIADRYADLVSGGGKKSAQGQPKFEAEVLAAALAVYVTNSSLAGTAASAYGFHVTATGLGYATFNVGASGAAFGVPNNSTLPVLDLLLAVNARSHNGLLFDLDHSGALESSERAHRDMASDLFSAINKLSK
jgi:hypothetical protein